MPDNHPLAGIYTASLTPLKPDLSPDPGPVARYLDFLAARGNHGALMLGTTGEGPSFSPTERITLFRAAAEIRQQRSDFRLLAGTGTPSLQETIELNKAAFEAGFEAVVTLPPFYIRNAKEDGLFAWFDQVIRRSVPEGRFLLGYHIPGVAGIGFSLDLLARLKDAHPHKFAGIKDSSHDKDFLRALGRRFGPDLLVLNGTDSYFSLAMDAHAGGAITAPANLISPDLRAVWDACRNGADPSEAQARVTQARETLEKYMPFPPMLKALAARLHGFPRWPVRPPLVEFDDELVERAAEELAAVKASLTAPPPQTR
ncbi:MAG: dihydrodipicolinate synthase family protein [Chloroflexota bacterium]